MLFTINHNYILLWLPLVLIPRFLLPLILHHGPAIYLLFLIYRCSYFIFFAVPSLLTFTLIPSFHSLLLLFSTSIVMTTNYSLLSFNFRHSYSPQSFYFRPLRYQSLSTPVSCTDLSFLFLTSLITTNVRYFLSPPATPCAR